MWYTRGIQANVSLITFCFFSQINLSFLSLFFSLNIALFLSLFPKTDVSFEGRIIEWNSRQARKFQIKLSIRLTFPKSSHINELHHDENLFRMSSKRDYSESVLFSKKKNALTSTCFPFYELNHFPQFVCRITTCYTYSIVARDSLALRADRAGFAFQLFEALGEVRVSWYTLISILTIIRKQSLIVFSL